MATTDEDDNCEFGLSSMRNQLTLWIHRIRARCWGKLRRRANLLLRGGAAVRRSQRYLVLGLMMTAMPAGIVTFVTASPASADCSGAGYATVCAQGEVRGGGPTPPSAGPYYPGYCADPWYCDDGWDLDVDLPIRPGRPGGIGPRR